MSPCPLFSPYAANSSQTSPASHTPYTVHAIAHPTLTCLTYLTCKTYPSVTSSCNPYTPVIIHQTFALLRSIILLWGEKKGVPRQILFKSPSAFVTKSFFTGNSSSAVYLYSFWLLLENYLFKILNSVLRILDTIALTYS